MNYDSKIECFEDLNAVDIYVPMYGLYVVAVVYCSGIIDAFWHAEEKQKSQKPYTGCAKKVVHFQHTISLEPFKIK